MIDQHMKTAVIGTQASAGSALFFWGVHISISDLGVIVSAAAAVGSLLIQAYMARRKVLQEDEERERIRKGRR